MGFDQNRSISYLLCALQKAKSGVDSYNLLQEVWRDWIYYLEELGNDEKELMNSLIPYLGSYDLTLTEVEKLVAKARKQAKLELSTVRRDLKLFSV